MDPNVMLSEIRVLAIELHASNEPERIELADELGPMILELDQWLTKGGFLPDAWNRNRVK